MDEGAKVPGQDAFLEPEAKITSGNETSRSHAPRRRKLIRLMLALLLVAIALTAWLVWDSNPTGPPQIVTLPSGEKYQFAGVTYGTKDVPPSLEAKVFDLLPSRLANLAQKYVGPQISQFNRGGKFETPQLFVWFRPMRTNAPLGNTISILAALLTDQAGKEAGGSAFAYFANGLAWSYASFPVFPRRSRLLECGLYTYDPTDRGTIGIPVAYVSFPNPLYGPFPQWKPEPIPAVKMAGDLEVSLDDIMVGRQWEGPIFVTADEIRGSPVEPAMRGKATVTAFDVSLRSPKGTNETWVLNSAELSDATGNVLRNRNWFLSSINLHMGSLPPQQSGKTSYSESIGGMLWPDEAAWRLKLEFKRAVGFATEEVVTFKNVPVPAVGATNVPAITKSVGGVQIVLTKFARWRSIKTNALGMYETIGEIRVELPRKPAGVALDFLKMTTNAVETEQYGTPSPEFGSVAYVYNIPANAKTMNLTWVVQKTRTVEFLVPPPKPQ